MVFIVAAAKVEMLEPQQSGADEVELECERWIG